MHVLQTPLTDNLHYRLYSLIKKKPNSRKEPITTFRDQILEFYYF